MLLLSGVVSAQDSVQSDSLSSAVSDSIASSSPDSLEKPPEKITPWVFSRKLGYSEVTNDSLLRWQIWPSWGDWYSRRNNIISYRQGTVSRVDAFLISGIEPRFQRLKWNGIQFNDPVTGLVNFNEVPHHKLRSVTEREGFNYENEIFFKNYYTSEPITQLNFDESKFDYRNLEFVFARNLSQKTNLELSYWDRRDAGAFSRGDVQGSQVFGKLIHHFNNQWLLQGHYLRNQYDRQESFGYNLPADLSTFTFSRFTTIPNVTNGNSELLTYTWSFSLHQRGKEDNDEKFVLGIHRKKNENELRYPADTTFYNTKNFGLRARKWLHIGKLDVELGGNVNTYDAQDTSSVSISSWTEWEANSSAQFQVIDRVKLGAFIDYFGRDNLTGAKVGVQANLQPIKKIRIDVDASTGDRLPSIQQLYWRSRVYSGNTSLITEAITSVGGGITFSNGKGLEMGIKGRYRMIVDGVLLGLDSTFTNVPSYETLSATAFGSYNVSSWEASLSGTTTQFSSKDANTNALANRVNSLQPTVLIKGSAYAKGTIYNGATFVKAGFVGTFSPNIVETYSYVPDLGNWRLISDNLRNPSYFRLDFDFSARLRSIFIVLRWENILDGLAQRGYFETVGYPAQPRRFITGIRVLFRN